MTKLHGASAKSHRRWLATVAAMAMLLVSGCKVSESTTRGEKPQTQDIDNARKLAKDLSSQILDAIGLHGQTSSGGPGVSRCQDDPEHLYKIRHPWSVWGVPEQDMEKSMEHLKVELPKQGWKVVSYGPDKSALKSIELIADSTKSKFSVNITFLDKRKVVKGDPLTEIQTSGIKVDLVSACFRVPEGKTVDQY